MTMEGIRKIFEMLKRHNVITAILLTDIISTIFFLLNPFMVIISGDIDLFLGMLVGMLYVNGNKDPDQSHLNISLKTGIFGGLISSLSLIVISLFNIASSEYGVRDIILILVVLGQFLGIFFGLFFGLLMTVRERRD